MRNKLTDLMLADDPAAALQHAARDGSLADLLPEVDNLRSLDGRGLHKDVYEHSLQVLRNAVSLEDDGPDLVLRLAALLHDVGKPATRVFRGRRVSFPQHEVVGAHMVRKRLRALGFDRETVKSVSMLVALHMRLHGFAESGWTDSAVRRLMTDAEPELDRLMKVMRSDVTSKRGSRRAQMRRMYDQFAERVQKVRAADKEAAIRPDLNGDQVMALLDLKPGRQVGEAMKFLLQLRKNEGSLPQDEAEQRLKDWAASHLH